MLLSVIITTFNEAHNLQALLPQLIGWADEVLVIDSGSTDQTTTIAQKMGATLLQRPYTSPADQKNWALKQVQNTWTLILDADERVTLPLKSEIQNILATTPTHDGYYIKRTNFFMNQQVRFSGWQNDRAIRLVNAKKCQYNARQVHEEIDTHHLNIGILKNPMLHYTYRNKAHYEAKIDRYARWSALDQNSKTPNITFFHLYIKPAFRFIKHYILRLGILDGTVGLYISRMAAREVHLRYQYMRSIRTNHN